MPQKNVLTNSTKCAAYVKNTPLQYNNNYNSNNSNNNSDNNNLVFVLPGKFEWGKNL